MPFRSAHCSSWYMFRHSKIPGKIIARPALELELLVWTRGAEIPSKVLLDCVPGARMCYCNEDHSQRVRCSAPVSSVKGMSGQTHSSPATHCCMCSLVAAACREERNGPAYGFVISGLRIERLGICPDRQTRTRIGHEHEPVMLLIRCVSYGLGVFQHGVSTIGHRKLPGISAVSDLGDLMSRRTSRLARPNCADISGKATIAKQAGSDAGGIAST